MTKNHKVKLFVNREINPNGSGRIDYDDGSSVVIDPNSREVRTYQRRNNFLTLKKEESMKLKHWNLLTALRKYVAQAA